jgi:hypothetical protein
MTRLLHLSDDIAISYHDDKMKQKNEYELAEMRQNIKDKRRKENRE